MLHHVFLIALTSCNSFNSYTQQICIDDAVVVDPNRAENVVTNDGTTMRIMSQSALKPSAWNRQREIVNDTRAEKAIALISEKALSPAPIGSLKGSETINSKSGMLGIVVWLPNCLSRRSIPRR